MCVAGRGFAGGAWVWLSGFSLLTGASLVLGYALLGACWLNWKTQGDLQRQAVTYAGRFGIALLIAIGGVSLATLRLDANYAGRWLSMPDILFTALVPLATIIVTVMF